MKTIFDRETRNELANRIHLLTDNSTAQWGKMNVSQMLKHCTQWEEMALGKTKYKQSFIGKLFGKMALKGIMKKEPMKKNMPTVPSFKITENTDVAEEKKKWIELLDEYENFSGNEIMHPFFGVMTKEQTGYLVYKHSDHHLKQFGA